MGRLSLSTYRAGRLHRQAQALSSVGDDDAALALYDKCLEFDPDRPETLYNIGLIYKYRGEWEKSFEFNSRAYALSPFDEASRWNLAIAATALRRWPVARRAWRDNGLDIADSDEPISMDFGNAPVRLNPNDDGEVVWGVRIDPVRVVIKNIPFPESGFRTNDIVLHDGAAVGSRVVEGREYPVFNVLELFEPSNVSTYVAHIRVLEPEQLERFAQLANSFGVVIEDWTGNVRPLCKKCSDGTPHSTHDQDGEEAWNTVRRVGLGCSTGGQFEAVIAACKEQGILEIEHAALELSA